MANKYVIDRKVAISIKNKRTILTQMCMKKLIDNSSFFKTDVKKETVKNFVKKMQALAYDERFRFKF